jgi:cyclic-di-GMP-binding biofilm dispersal mediator protein
MGILAGKTAFVTGGSRGIGAAIVRRLAAEGAAVTFTYGQSGVAATALATETGATAVAADSADRAAFGRAIAAAGPLDILVLNAGIIAFGAPDEIAPDTIDRMIDVNIRAPYHNAVEAGRTMRLDGRIVVIGSVNADRVPLGEIAAYAMTKSAVQGMIRGLARAYGSRGITVNAVQPGPVDTDMNPADGPLKDVMHGPMAIKRHARPDEVAGMVAYLVGPEAAMVTGAMHTIDGGFGA